MMEAVATDQKLDKKLDTLLNQFEREVEPYDRWAGISMFSTPVGVIASIFVPLILTWPSLEITGSALWWIIGGIVATSSSADNNEHGRRVSESNENRACRRGG